MYYKVEIFPKNEGFIDEIFEYLLENSPIFKREFSIDNILNEVCPLTNLQKLSPIEISEKYGSTFQ